LGSRQTNPYPLPPPPPKRKKIKEKESVINYSLKPKRNIVSIDVRNQLTKINKKKTNNISCVWVRKYTGTRVVEWERPDMSERLRTNCLAEYHFASPV
jgi:hypothetical protein